MPGCPMNHLQQEEIITRPSAVPALSLQIELAAGNQRGTSAFSPFPAPPTGSEWASDQLYPSAT